MWTVPTTAAAALALVLTTTSSCLNSASAFQPGGFFTAVSRTQKTRLATCRIAIVSARHSAAATSMSLGSTGNNSYSSKIVADAARAFATLAVGASMLFGDDAAVADGGTKKFSLPPVSQVKDRCNFKSSAMGQANAARDSLYDLRDCDLSGKSAAGFDLSGVIASEADFSKADFKEVTMSKSYARNSKWDGADFTNAVVDRVSFDGSSMQGTIFKNAVLTSTSFVGANVENADFTEAYMGEFDQRTLCKNPTLKGTNPVTNADTRASAGCPEL